MIPADADADPAVTGIPHLEARIAGAEVILLLIAGTVRDMGLAVNAHETAVRIDDGHAVEARLVLSLEKTDRQDNVQFSS